MIYVDTNIFIYAIENHPEYGNACKKILLGIESEKLEATASMLVLIEILNVLSKINKVLKKSGKKELDVKKNIEAIISLPITWIEINFFIIKKAADYKYQIMPADYIHLATMESNSVAEIISADTEFDKVKSIHRIDPLKY